ncbi:MAG: hypothetical protein WCC60_20385, partial [Ilumatobacteraceae bacterium]
MHDNRTGAAQSASRAIEYLVKGSSASLVWSYPTTYASGTLGSVRRLADGSTVIAWGTASSPWLEQIRADGSHALTISVNGGVNIYRAEPSAAAAFDRAVLRSAAGGAAPPA